MSHHTWLHRVGQLAVAPLVNTAVTPNQLTTARLCMGLAGAIACGLGSPVWLHVGGVLFLISILLDRADGELARLTDRVTEIGHKYDLVADALCNSLIFVGLGIGLSAPPLGGWAMALGVIAGVSISAVLLLVVSVEQESGPRAAELRGKAGFDPDDGMLAVPILIWLGLAQELLIAAAVGAPSFALYFFWRSRRMSRLQRQ